ncbi:MAG TPA: hypothetical protein VIO95_11900, partial [Mycobacterium sp.]
MGLGSSAGAFLAFGLYPLAGAPMAKADVFDDILDMVVGSAASSAITAVNPTDFIDLGTPAGWESLFNDLGNASSLEALFSPPSAISDASSAAATADSSSSLLHGLEQDWINSSFGQQIDSALNSWFNQADPAADPTGGACGLICNGANGISGGSLSDANGQGGGIFFGNGGNGATDAAGQGGVGGNADFFGNGGNGGDGADGGAGG